jgi:hypothetical protein
MIVRREEDFVCDICGYSDSDLNKFTAIYVQKYPSKVLPLHLCEDKCYRKFVKFWKDADRDIEQEMNDMPEIKD